MSAINSSATLKATYPPLGTMKEVVADLWIVDGPAVRFGVPCLRMAFPTRMTIVRTTGQRLFIHSPTPLSPALKMALAQVGTVHWLVGPNRLHTRWLQEWAMAYPDARVYVAPGVEEDASEHGARQRLVLNGTSSYGWEPDLALLPVGDCHFTEIVFFHFLSRTLILTDLIENFEADRLDSPMAKILTSLGGVQDPDGQMPRDMRLLFARDRRGLRMAVEKMIRWNPERVILAHGRWYARDGTAELRRAFRWLISEQ
jgi:hypothetical protein